MTTAGNTSRTPPHSPDAERAVIGTLIVDQSTIHSVADILVDSDFYAQPNRLVYSAVMDLYNRAAPVDLLTVSEEMGRTDALSRAGGSAYLSRLCDSVASTKSVEHLARIVKEKSMLRQVIETTTGLLSDAYDPAVDALEVIQRAESEIYQVSSATAGRECTPVGESARHVLKRLEDIQGSPGGLTGVPSGLSRLDRLTSGWQPSDLIILAARPSMGKTAMALTWAVNAARSGVGVAIFSLEMSTDQLTQRMLTSEARVDSHLARTGRLGKDEWDSITRAAGRVHDMPIYIDDTPGLNVYQLRSKCRRLKAEKNIGLVVLDYLQLMSPAEKASSAEQEVAHMSRHLKLTAKEMGLPVIALSQLSRAVEYRAGDKRPQLSDLRTSGSIEQDADVVGFIYRPERYGIMVDEAGRSTEGRAEIILAKQRNGPIGNVGAAFVERYSKFENIV